MKNISKSKLIVIANMFIVVVVLVMTASTASFALTWNFTVPAQEVRPSSTTFQFPLASFNDGQAKHYVYKHSPSEWVRFFVVKSTDGVVRAAFDACDVCWRSKKGYVQAGNFMQCVNCGLKFRTDKINETKGGCNPAALARTIAGDKVVINVQDVMSGLGFFQ
jgi:uncharacterized membrane protein